MRPFNIGQKLLRQEKTTDQKSLSFRSGQIVNGKVLKLYPNQIASVQIGSHKVIAQLETPLSVNDRHWFQVQAGEGKVHLKVFETPSENGKPPMVENLLKQLTLPVSKENAALIQFFLREQLPITKDSIQMATEWLKGSHSFHDSMQAIKLQLSKQLPYTKDVFLSILSVMKDESLSSMLDQLQSQLKTDLSSDTASRLSSLINEISMTEKEKASNIALVQLVKEWVGSFGKERSETAFKLLQNLGFIAKDESEDAILNQAVEKWVGKENKLSGQTNGRLLSVNLFKEILANNQPGKREEFILSLTKLQNHLEGNPAGSSGYGDVKELKHLLTEVRANNLPIPLSEGKITSLSKEIFRALIPEINMDTNKSPDSSLSLLTSMIAKNGEQAFMQLAKVLSMDDSDLTIKFSAQEQALLANLKKEVQIGSVQWENSHVVNEQIKKVIRIMGLSYEHEAFKILKQPEVDGINKIDTLKPLLMRLLNEEAPAHIKDAAEKLLHKITGFQVLSQEVGPIQQYIFQIPLSFWDKKTDLTMQWSGKKTENGKIDPNYCRVLFYLNLDFLKETIVDLQVQNRVMNITIINDKNDLKMLAAPLFANLKEGLAILNYQLSSITFEKPADNKQIIEAKDAVTSQIMPNQFNGVDFRI
ncbi:hypothetical protein BGM26_02260 [Bacillus sp. FJAT-29790]|uniref:hypothetical protein n=1 Tax=Bacillus sp. FJAT-29790 TaxID=1895002 RepID=UPI001C21A2C7|nr:hypothetical protein [Bacillus sp. FJAT-29790]MBU8877814.1 hypothetical protein [Bacillus sp. FJAT-29790]